LFRGGKEGNIRKRIIEANLVECVILLPEKLFYNTGAPGAIIIFNKNKPAERKDKVLFINASEEFVPHPSVRRLNSLSKENIEKIAQIYHGFKEVEGFSRIVGLDEIREYDYSLNVTLYVMPVEEREEIDIAKEYAELKELEGQKQEVMNKLEKYLTEITQALGGSK